MNRSQTVSMHSIMVVGFLCLASVLGFGAPAPTNIHPSVEQRFDLSHDEPIKVWVLFEDRKGHDSDEAINAALDQVRQNYNHRAIERRTARRTAPGLFDRHDLPVPPRYIEAVARTGVTIKRTSRWVNGISVIANREHVAAIARLPFVKQIQPVRTGRKFLPIDMVEAAGPASPGSIAAGFYGNSEAQLTQINLVNLHNQGFTGTGVRVGILDTGFKRAHQAFNEPGHPVSILAEYDFINNDNNTSIEAGDDPSQHSHGTYILGVLGSYKPNVLVGGAYNASFILCKTEDVTSETQVEEDNYVEGLEFIELNGGDMATASLGYIDWYTQADLDGMTAVTTIAVNVATGNGIHCLNAAGNEGHDANPVTSSIIAPADAFDVITCGAADGAGVIASFSSDGPTADGRLKPEVLALGVSTQTVTSISDTNYTTVSGTSLSTPLVAAATACLIQAHPTWTVHQMRRYLMFTAGDYIANQNYDPTYVRGYGIINAALASTEDCNNNSVADSSELTGNDCNGNLMPDDCDLDQGISPDQFTNGVPDECDAASGLIPAVSQWGAMVMALLLVIAGGRLIRLRHRLSQRQ